MSASLICSGTKRVADLPRHEARHRAGDAAADQAGQLLDDRRARRLGDLGRDLVERRADAPLGVDAVADLAVLGIDLLAARRPALGGGHAGAVQGDEDARHRQRDAGRQDGQPRKRDAQSREPVHHLLPLTIHHRAERAAGRRMSRGHATQSASHQCPRT
jgi:hypothetical protein